MKRFMLMCAVLLALFWGAGAQAQTPERPTSQEAAMEQLQKLTRFYRYLHGLYVEAVDMSPLVEEAIRAMLLELDPHSAYLDREAMEAEKVSMEGQFSGIGIEFRVVKDTIRVQHVLGGGAAERAGLRAGDRILRIDTLAAVGLKQHEVPKYLRGDQGSKVELEVMRPMYGDLLHFTLVRDRVPLHTVSAAYRLDDGTGYIKIDRFGRTTSQEVEAALDSLGRVERLILDLQGNPGGLLQQAIRVGEQFLPAGSLIVSTEGRAVAEQTHGASHRGLYRKGELVLLVDEQSASAAEIVAGAVQDWDRGLILGRPTFGKGLVQRQIGLGDGSAVRITIARYHTPSGRVIQRPYAPGEREAYYAAHLKRRLSGGVDTLPDSLPRYRTLRLGREVVGGGGIRPDVVIEADTSGYSPFYGELIRRNLLNDFVLSHVDRNRAELLARYPAYDQFNPTHEESESLFEALKSHAAEQGLVSTPEAERSREWIDLQLRVALATALYGSQVRIRAWNDARGNRALNRAQELLAARELPAELSFFRDK